MKNIGLVGFILAGLIVCICYWPGLSGDYIFDDQHTVVDNEKIKLEELSVLTLRQAAYSFAGGGRQLSMISFALNQYLFGHTARSYKTVNLVLHIIVGSLIFLLVRIIVEYLPRPYWATGNFSQLVPLVTSVLWLFSPINLIPTLYVSQRMTQLSALFMVAGILFYCMARAGKKRNKLTKVVLFILAFLCFPLAYLSKENGALLLLFLMLVEITVFRFYVDQSIGWCRSQTNLLLLVIFVVVVLSLVAITNPFGLMSGYSYRSFDLDQRLYTQARIVLFYINQTVLPINFLLGMWHDDFVLSSGLLKPWNTVFAIACIILLLSISVVFIKRATLICLGILWFFLGHIIESSVLPLEMMHEHRNYFPSIGVFIVVSSFLFRILSFSPKLGRVCIILLLTYNALMLGARANNWSNEFVHAESEYLHHPNSPRASFSFATLVMQAYIEGYHNNLESVLTALQGSIDLQRFVILPDVTLLIFQNSQHIQYSDGLIENISEKFEKNLNLNLNVRPLQVLRRCIADGDCKFNSGELDNIYILASKSANNKIREEAVLYYSQIRYLRNDT